MTDMWEWHEFLGGSWPQAKCERVESVGCSWYECRELATHPIHQKAE